MISRRAMLAGMGGLPFTRPDQHYEPPAGGAQIPGARGLIRARAVIIVGSPPGFGLFVYTPTVAAGNLIDSISLGGSDGHTNSALADIVNYTLIGGNYFAVRLGGGAIGWYSGGPSEGGPWTQTSQISGANSPDLTLQSNRHIVTQQLLTAIGGLTVTASGADAVALSGGSLLLQLTSTLAQGGVAQAQFTSFVLGSIWAGYFVTGDTSPRLRLDTTAAGVTRIGLGPGNAGPDALIVRDAANHLAVNGADLDINTVGRGLQVAEGTNARMGRSVLVAGTVVVSNTSVTAATEIFLTCNVPGGTPGFLRVSARTAGTSFTILSSSGTDTSTVSWLLIEPG